MKIQNWTTMLAVMAVAGLGGSMNLAAADQSGAPATQAVAKPEASTMKAFPPAETGMVRYVLPLPPQKDETGFQVELVAGKTIETDGVNRYFLGGKIEEKNIEGWGFPRYDVSIGHVGSTKMGGGTPGSARQFVSVNSNLLRYNSRLPIVAYAPEGIEMRYRLWNATETKAIDPAAEAAAIAKAGSNMKAYAPAAPGMVRHVLQLPAQKDEYGFRIELIAGKTVETDGVNRCFLGGKIEENNVEGWGFPRYDVSVGGMASTLIGVPSNQPKVKTFVTIGGTPKLFRYNSRLPVVVYAPEGVEIRYRIWTTGADSKAMEKN